MELKTFLKHIHPLSNKELEEYISHWEEVSLPKGTIMTEENKTENYLYFVLEGIQKAYFLHSNGKQHITFFAFPPSFCGVVDSFLTQTPSRYYLETVTNSKFLRISYESHSNLLEKYRALETLSRKATEQFLHGILQRYHELMAFDIELRYKSFAKRSPHLFTMLSQKDIASYLNIDSTNLSKLLNKVQI